ncbi:hypothetical protein RFI_03846, partial [Reticulomyxa filosa]
MSLFCCVQGPLPFRKRFFNLHIFFLSQMEQLQEAFSTIEKEIIFNIWLSCFITPQQQQNLMNLLKTFGNKMDKTTILKTWRNCNQIYVDTREKLEDICATSNLNESKEENEFKILKEMCLHILWNILKYPRHIKYHQINKQALYNNLLSKCHMLGVNVKRTCNIIDLKKEMTITGIINMKIFNYYIYGI